MPNNDTHNIHTGSGDIVGGDKYDIHNHFPPNKEEKPPFPPLHNAKDFSLAHPTIGRDNDLAAVCNMLAEQQQCIVVNGIGGIGKSTLVKYYIQQYKAKYQHIIWLQEKEHAADILLDDSVFLTHLGINNEVLAYKNASNQEAALELAITKLNELPKQVLLIADNVRDLYGFETLCNALNKDTFHLLATSRKQTGDFCFHELDHFSLPDAKDLFVSYCTKKTRKNANAAITLKGNPTLERILVKIESHTLTIEIIAKIYDNSHINTLESLEQKLNQAILNTKLTQTAYTHYTKKEATILETLLAAFDISDLAQNPAALTLLAQWAVLPATPIPHTHLLALFGITEENEDAFDKNLDFLIENAWIQKAEEAETSYACHALIQEAVRWQIKEEEIDYIPLINQVNSLFQINSDETPLSKQAYLPYGESICIKYKIENKAIIILLNSLLTVFIDTGYYNKGIFFAEKCFNIATKILRSDDTLLADTYSNYSIICRRINKYDIALEYGKKAIDIREKALLPNDIFLARYYDNIANVYNNLGNPEQALIFNKKNLKILLSIEPQPLRELAKSYTNLSATYQQLKDYQQELDYDLKALEIKEKMYLSDDPSLAQSYNNIGVSYHNHGKLDEALSCHFKALKIRKKVFSLPNLYLAESYHNIGVVYNDKKEYEKALNYYFEALQIRKELLSPESDDLGNTCYRIARAYYNLYDYLQSLAYFQQAIQIWKKSLPSGHPNTKGAIGSMEIVLQHAIAVGQGEVVREYLLWYAREGKGGLV